jgi:hypothetical protein
MSFSLNASAISKQNAPRYTFQVSCAATEARGVLPRSLNFSVLEQHSGTDFFASYIFVKQTLTVDR